MKLHINIDIIDELFFCAWKVVKKCPDLAFGSHHEWRHLGRRQRYEAEETAADMLRCPSHIFTRV